MRISRPYIAVIIACLATFSARAQEQWIEIRSPHFSLLTDAERPKGREIALYFEQMRSVMEFLLPLKGGTPRTPLVQIIAFHDKKYINDFGLLLDQDTPSARLVLDSGDVQENREQFSVGIDGSTIPSPFKVKEVYLHSDDQDYVLLNLLVKRDWRTVFHQYAHVVLENNFPQLPRWFVEGFAEYYAAVKIVKQNIDLSSEPKMASDVLGHKEWIPILAIFGSNGPTEQDTRYSQFYAESWLVVDYLYSRRKMDDATTYFRLVREGAAVPEAIQQAFKMTPEELDHDVHDYFHQTRRVVTVPLPELKSKFSVSAVPPLELQAVLADAHLHEPGYHKKAVQEFGEVLQKDPDNATAHRGLALDALRRSDFQSTVAQLQKAAERTPDDWKLHYYWARLLRQRDDPSLAQQTEKQARLVIKLNPEFSEGYAILGTALAWQGKNAEASLAFENAMRLGPSREVYAMNLAMVYFAQDKYQQAKPLFSQLQNSNDKKFAEASRAYLRSIAKLEQKSPGH